MVYKPVVQLRRLGQHRCIENVDGEV
jgi:hypothetical protein